MQMIGRELRTLASMGRGSNMPLRNMRRGVYLGPCFPACTIPLLRIDARALSRVNPASRVASVALLGHTHHTVHAAEIAEFLDELVSVEGASLEAVMALVDSLIN